MRRFKSLFLSLCALLAGGFSAESAAQPDAPPVTQLAQGTAATPSSDEPMQSTAERVARLQRSIHADMQRLKELEQILNDPQGEYQITKAEFERLDGELKAAKRRLPEGTGSEGADPLPGELAALETGWKLAKERFELEFEELRVVQDQVATLQKKIPADESALARLIAPPAAPVSTTVEPPPATVPAPTTAQPEALAPSAPAPATPLSLAPGGTLAGAAMPAESPAAAVEPILRPAPEKPRRADEVAAAEAVRQTEADAQQAEDDAKSVAERIELLRQNIGQTRELRQTARKKVDNAEATAKRSQEELQAKLAAGVPSSALWELNDRIEESMKWLRSARDESRQRADRLDELQTDLEHLLSDKIAADEAAERKRHEAETAKARLQYVQNPFTPENLLNWTLSHGPKIFGIMLFMVAFLWLSRVLETRLVGLVTRRGGRGGLEERENRAKTLVGVFRNVATIAILAGGTLMLLDEVALPVGPLMGGAAVAGLAVAFGAQNLIKDFFTGFIILMEQQYMVNDVVKIGDVGGQVERITLRMTVLRDLEGRVHFMPHGQIASVTNLTHGWSRAVLEIGVAYKEDVDRVIGVLMELGQQLRNDPEYAPLILEDPMMLGVDSLGDSAVVVKFFIKTRPLRQWPVKRELLRRIKNTFDQLGIEIPFPHRTVYHRTVGESGRDSLELHGDWPEKRAG